MAFPSLYLSGLDPKKAALASHFNGNSGIVHSATMAPKKWGVEDDKKLAELFRRGPRSGGISTSDLGSKAIHAIIAKHFPEREYKNFAPLFRGKARAWNVNQTLTGQRSK